MDDNYESETIISQNTRNSVRDLNLFLAKYKTPKACPYTNVTNQLTGETYCLPYDSHLSKLRPVPMPDQSQKENQPNYGDSEYAINPIFTAGDDIPPYVRLFMMLEACRLDGISQCYCERQFFTIPFRDGSLTLPTKPALDKSQSLSNIDDDGEFDIAEFDDAVNKTEGDPQDLEGWDVEIPSDDTSTSTTEYKELQGGIGIKQFPGSELSLDQSKDVEIEKSCIEYDFDIYKRDKSTSSSNIAYGLINASIMHIAETLDWGYDESKPSDEQRDLHLTFHAAYLRKPQRPITDPNESSFKRYGAPLYKESFHVRFFVKVTKAVKIYLRKRMLADPVIQDLFAKSGMINSAEEAFDKNITANPTMFLGNMKRGGTQPHELEALFLIKYTPSIKLQVVQPQDEFKFVDRPAQPIFDGAGRKRGVLPPERYCKYNLCFELSLNFEVPGGLIKKYEFDPRMTLKSEINSYEERIGSGDITESELNEYENQVTTLTTQDFDALYIRKILDIVGRHRAIDYECWKRVVVALARKNKDYKPLAIWFSLRYASSFVKDGLKHINGLWEFAEQRKTRDLDHTSILSIYNWAKQDNITEYNILQQNNLFMKLQKKLLAQQGQLNNVDFASILRDMWGHTFRCDQSRVALGKGTAALVWREFVYPDTDKADGQLYKWRKESYLYTLQQYISKKMPGYLDKILDWLESKVEKVQNEGTDATVPGSGGSVVSTVRADEQKERSLKYFETVKRGIKKTKFSLGNMTTINMIMKACEPEFLRGNRGFEDDMDGEKVKDYIGTTNGVLRLYPKLQLIQGYHEIPISKSVTVPYVPYDPENYYVKQLEPVLLDIFNNNRETFEFWMMLLASGLDDRQKSPQYFITGHGSGSQGKTVISSFDLYTKGIGRPGGEGGYAAKLDVGWLCQDRKGTGPDAALASTKKMRTIHCAESEVEAAPRIGKIKEILSEMVSGNDKNEKQDTWKVNAHIIMMTNHKMRIIGRDYGTMRRILYYRFKRQYKQVGANVALNDRYDPNDPTHSIARPEVADEWVNDHEFQTAYFSILTHYYEILRDRYKYNLRNVPHKEIERETDAYFMEQDTLTQFIGERAILFSTGVYPDGTAVELVPITEIMQKYIKWHNTIIGGNSKFNNQELKNDILTHYKLEKYFVNAIGGEYLKFHKVLDLNESITKYIETAPTTNTTNDFSAEALDSTTSPSSAPVPEPITTAPTTEQVFEDFELDFDTEQQPIESNTQKIETNTETKTETKIEDNIDDPELPPIATIDPLMDLIDDLDLDI
jgi:phage/plasmid-associated DNA primase